MSEVTILAVRATDAYAKTAQAVRKFIELNKEKIDIIDKTIEARYMSQFERAAEAKVKLRQLTARMAEIRPRLTHLNALRHRTLFKTLTGRTGDEFAALEAESRQLSMDIDQMHFTNTYSPQRLPYMVRLKELLGNMDKHHGIFAVAEGLQSVSAEQAWAIYRMETGKFLSDNSTIIQINEWKLNDN